MNQNDKNPSRSKFLQKFKHKFQKISKHGEFVSEDSPEKRQKMPQVKKKLERKDSSHYFRLIQNKDKIKTLKLGSGDEEDQKKKKKVKRITNLLTERKQSNNSSLQFVSLPHVFKTDPLRKAKDLRIKADTSLKLSHPEVREETNVTPKKEGKERISEMKVKLRYLQNSNSSKRSAPLTERKHTKRSLIQEGKRLIKGSVKRKGKDHLVTLNSEAKGLPKLNRMNIKNFAEGFETFGEFRNRDKYMQKPRVLKRFTPKAQSGNLSRLSTPEFSPYKDKKSGEFKLPRSISSSTTVDQLPSPDYSRSMKSVGRVQILRVR